MNLSLTKTLALALTLFAAPLAAQPSGTGTASQPACPATAPPAASATPPTSGPNSGTSPGGMGSTAWSGGTGGSYVGTAPAGGRPSSPNPQPDTASGLDPTRPSSANPTC